MVSAAKDARRRSRNARVIAEAVVDLVVVWAAWAVPAAVEAGRAVAAVVVAPAVVEAAAGAAALAATSPPSVITSLCQLIFRIF